MIKVAVIIGSIRPGRVEESVARRVYDIARRHRRRRVRVDSTLRLTSGVRFGGRLSPLFRTECFEV